MMNDTTIINLLLDSSDYAQGEIRRKRKQAAYGDIFNKIALDHIFIGKDGKINIVSSMEYTTSDGSGGNYYFSNQIFNLILTPEGKWEKIIFIPKYQLVGPPAPDPGFFEYNWQFLTGIVVPKIYRLGYLLMLDNEEMYYIFNGAYRMSDANNEDVSFQNGNKLGYVVVDNRGNMTRYPLIENDSQDIRIMPRNSITIDAKNIVAFASMGKSSKTILIRLSLDTKK